MIEAKEKLLRTLTRRFWGCLFTLLIGFAVIVQLSRQALPLLEDYQEDISQYFGQRVGMEIDIRSLRASWTGLRPKLRLSQVSINAKNGEPVFKIASATLELSIINSLRDRRLSWRQLIFEGFETSLVQAEDGSWKVEGMPEFKKKAKPNSDGFQVGDPYDIFLVGRRIKISDAMFNLSFTSGVKTEASIPVISIDNDSDFHRIRASLDVGGGAKAFDMLVEGYGDPRDNDFIAKGFVELKNFPSSEVLDALALSPSREEDDQKINLKLWFQGDAQKGTHLSGELAALGRLRFGDNTLTLPSEVTTQFYGELSPERAWSLTFRQLTAKWDELSSPPMDIMLYGDVSRLGGLRIPHLDAKAWTDLALHVGLGAAKTEEMIAQLNPRGIIRNIDLALTDKESGYFTVQANIENGYAEALKGAPAFENVNGFVSANLRSGRVYVNVDDGFTMDLPKVYNDPLYFAQAEGEVRWKIDFENKIAYLSSGLLTVTNPEEQGKGYFNLSLPFRKEYGTQSLTLAIGIQNTLALSHKKYVPKTVPDDLYQWLDVSIKEGDISNARFLYHGSVEKDPEVSPTIQLYGEVSGGGILFDPNWPQLEDVSGQLWLDNQNLDVHISEARLLGNAIRDAKVKLLHNSGAANDRAIAIDGHVVSDAPTAMAFLKNSPLQQNIGAIFDDWEVSGGVEAKVELVVPISGEAREPQHKVDVVFKEATLNMKDLSIELHKVSGKLHHYYDQGLFADGLQGTLWDRPFTANIANPENTDGSRDTRIEFDGAVDIENLYDWTLRPELRFANGMTSVRGHINIPAASRSVPMEVAVTSNLNGVEIRLPQPFAKSTSEEIPFDAHMQFFNYAQEYVFTVGQKARLGVLNTKNAVTSVQLDIDNFADTVPKEQRIANSGRFDVRGHLGDFDFEQWLGIKEQYLHYTTALAGSEPDTSPGIPVSLSVVIDQFLLGDFAIENLAVSGGRETEYWDLAVQSELMAGRIRVPEQEETISMALDYLRFETEAEAQDVEGENSADLVESDESQLLEQAGDTEALASSSETVEAIENQDTLPSDRETDEETAQQETALKETVPEDTLNGDTPSLAESLFVDVDLARAVPLDFSTRELSIGGVDYGRWQFELRPIDGGIALHNMTAESKGLLVGSVGQGAEFIWIKQGDEEHSQFVGQIHAKNLADVFEAFDQEKLIISDEASFDIDAKWPGAPDVVTLNSIKGVVGVDIQSGSFTRGAGSDENGLLRLIALFNLDTIVRRLRLDFSDLTAEGYAFDKIYGDLNFENGNIVMIEPMIVTSSSSNMQFAGTVDLIGETIDSDMVVTLPMASNVAIATALIVGLPAALGVYVMSKLFKKQVDRASSLNVGITGKWEDPKVKVKNIFDLDAASRRGKAIKRSEEAASESAAEQATP